jgi:hypothetical protein
MIRAAKLSVRHAYWGALPLRELLIDGRTIQDLVAKHTQRRSAMLDSCVSPLGWLDSADAQVSLARFLPDGPADFSAGHRAILVCRECGSFGCGALSIRITAEGGNVIWSDWLWQVDYDDDSQHDHFENKVPKLAFELEDYLSVLRNAVR